MKTITLGTPQVRSGRYAIEHHHGDGKWHWAQDSHALKHVGLKPAAPMLVGPTGNQWTKAVADQYLRLMDGTAEAADRVPTKHPADNPTGPRRVHAEEAKPIILAREEEVQVWQ